MPARVVDHPLAAAAAHPELHSKTSFWTLALGSIGVVYGDIGTSPLYALKESLSATAAGGSFSRGDVFAVVSLILWALIIVVTLKYVLIIMRADNNGEGGMLTLMALLQRVMGRDVFVVTLLGMGGAALFYGDAIITPAISVLSAVEGLKLVTPALNDFIVPLSLGILLVLFLVQSGGTARVGAWFGPLMVLWFAAMTAGGLVHIADEPVILAAINPAYGASFLLSHGTVGMLALGLVFLAVTGAEALYADMGHFGRKPIKVAWLALVLPSLAVNYLGQGALLLAHPEKIENPFFLLYPDWALLPMVGLATAATVIASQAVITGAFSLTQQAMQLGLLPRMTMRRTSETEKGQIYIPRVNWLLLVAVVVLVLIFKTASSLASAYGIAVTGTMVLTTVMAFLVMWKCWNWSPLAAGITIAPFLVVDVVFLAANLLKVFEGGWMPLAVGVALLVVMLTWRKGSAVVVEKTLRSEVPLVQFVEHLERSSAQRVQGTAVFLTGHPDSVPTALLHNLKHNRVLHQQNVILSVITADTPRVDASERVSVEKLGDSFVRVVARFGFMETPNIPRILPACRAGGLKFDVMRTSFFLSRRVLVPTAETKMLRWQEALFIWLAGTADDASRYFGIPSDRAVEVGMQIKV